MTLEEQAILSNYIELTALDSENRVWLVRDEITSAICVKKTVQCDSPSIYHRLKSEHIEGIPEIFQIIEDGDNVVLIEEYIHGLTAEQHFAQNVPTDESVMEFGIEICNILDTIHNMTPPIIYRDIKPSNIMISHGHYYLTDFNIARSYNDELNEDTRLLGTAPYASPEQYGFAQTDAKSDIYSLGVTMNVLRTGCLPKDKNSSGKLGEIISKATAIDPNDRYPDSKSMKEDLLCAVSGKRADPGYKGLTRFRKPKHIVAAVLYITWLVYLIQYDEQLTVYNQSANLMQEIAIKAVFFLLAFLPYFYNSNYFGIMDKTVGIYKKDSKAYWACRMLYTVLISLGIPIIITILFI